jgi:hypothetical protein
VWIWSCDDPSCVRILLFLSIINLLQIIIIIMFIIIFIYFSRNNIFCVEFVRHNLKVLHCHCSLIYIYYIIEFIGVFMIISIPDLKCLAALIHQWLPSDRKLNTDFVQLLCCFTFYKQTNKQTKIAWKRVQYFLDIYCHAAFQDPIKRH